ncbi:MAG TPA: LUD domain-containing protein, partial [Clostridiales bacterium]|nr:LUD domain-containing protein [Clostridiales bacterium]
RVENLAAPANTKRLSRRTPCTKTGYCMDCDSPERICNDYVLIKKQNTPGRIHVIIINKELGY